MVSSKVSFCNLISSFVWVNTVICSIRVSFSCSNCAFSVLQALSCWAWSTINWMWREISPRFAFDCRNRSIAYFPSSYSCCSDHSLMIAWARTLFEFAKKYVFRDFYTKMEFFTPKNFKTKKIGAKKIFAPKNVLHKKLFTSKILFTPKNILHRKTFYV